MRIASKNEVLTLLGPDLMNFAGYCLSEVGSGLKFVFDNTTNFDIDLEVFQSMLANLQAGGVISAETVARFASFGTIPGQPEYQPNLRTWQLTSTASTISDYIDYISPYLVFTGSQDISCSRIGEFSLVGFCNHPDAVEVL